MDLILILTPLQVELIKRMIREVQATHEGMWMDILAEESNSEDGETQADGQVLSRAMVSLEEKLGMRLKKRKEDSKEKGAGQDRIGNWIKVAGSVLKVGDVAMYHPEDLYVYRVMRRTPALRQDKGSEPWSLILVPIEPSSEHATIRPVKDGEEYWIQVAGGVK